jgi:hypothetical protein
MPTVFRRARSRLCRHIDRLHDSFPCLVRRARFSSLASLASLSVRFFPIVCLDLLARVGWRAVFFSLAFSLADHSITGAMHGWRKLAAVVKTGEGYVLPVCLQICASESEDQFTTMCCKMCSLGEIPQFMLMLQFMLMFATYPDAAHV